MSAVAVLGVTNLLTPLSYANAADYNDYDTMPTSVTAKSFSFIMPDHNVYMKAFTEANKYFVEYSGTTKTSGTMARDTFTYDETGTLSPLGFEKLGYTFENWDDGSGNTYADQAKVWNWTTVESGTVPIYAQWSANSYNISYDLNDTNGTISGVHSKEPSHLNYDQTGTIQNPSRTGYIFSGWTITNMDSNPHIVGGEESSAASATGVKGTSFKNLRATSGTVNFQAQWTRKTDTKYDVEHYTENLGSGWTLRETDNLSGTTDTEVTPSVHTYTGFTKKNGTPYSGNIDADGSTVFKYYYTRNSYDLTLVAGRGIAQVSGSGTQNTTGGSANDSVTISFKYEEPVTVHYELKSGYTGATWSGYQGASSSFNMLASGGTKTVSATPITYTITYHNYGGTTSGTNPGTYNVETTGFTLINPTRDHSVFEGWTGSNGSSKQMTVTIAQGSTGDKVYHANWSCIDGYHIENTGANNESCEADTDTHYMVKHIKQQLNGNYDDEDPIESEDKYGQTDAQTAVTENSYDGFKLREPIVQQTIRGDGTTVVNVYYEREKYDLTVNDPVGVSADSISVEIDGERSRGSKYLYEDTVKLSGSLAAGYNFSGWTVKDASGNNVPVNNASSLTNATFEMPASSVTVTPNVTRVTYTIQYELYSGHETSPNPTSYTVESGAITLNAPERDHSVFLGWTGSNGNVAQTSVTIPSGSVGNKKYYAVWGCATGYHDVNGTSCVANQYSGSVDFNDGTSHGAAEVIEFTYDQVTTLDNPEQSGYDFAGWDVTGMSGGVVHHLGTITTTGSSATTDSGATEFYNLSTEQGMTDITFTAIWTARDDTKYVIYHYYKDLGASTYTLSGTDNLTGTTDTYVTFTEKKKDKEGFTYSAGYLNVANPTTRPSEGAVTTGNIEKDGSTKIYLYYTRDTYTVSLSGDEHVATLSGAGTYEYGANVTVDMTAKTGYHFKEWRKKTDNTFTTDL